MLLPVQLDQANKVAAVQHASPLGQEWLARPDAHTWLSKFDEGEASAAGSSPMSLDMLRSFVKLGELCSYGRAAAQLGISQPTLTKQIQRLEDVLGERLFSRSRQGTVLTAFGERFLGEIAPAIHDMSRVWKSGVRIARGEARRLSIGCTPSAIDIMTKAISAYRCDHPDVHLGIHVLTSELQMQMVRARQLDVAFARWPGSHDLEAHLIAEDRLIFIYPKVLGHLVTGIRSPAVRDLPFIRLERSIAPGLESYVDRLLGSMGITPRLTHHVNESLVQLRLVAEGVGVAVMHESGLRNVANPATVGMQTIKHSGMRWQVGMFWRRNEVHSAARDFIETVAETCHKPVPES
ncbi:LysR family transcriptional regulator [Shinella sp. BYT-45]|uniref:LysR family transcriptional regulator n=1 Tax=Shinella sp. BYT-45 TaxID=3377377 RepID=UPI0039809005